MSASFFRSSQEDIPADISELIRLGTIASVDLGARRCTVLYGDEDDEGGGATTPPIRWLAPRAGKTRKASPPSQGEQVVLLCPDGQLASAIALLGLESDQFPLPVDGEADVALYEDGAAISYDPIAHALTAILPGGGTAAITASGGITLRGPVTVDGDVTLNGKMDATGDVKAGSISLQTHKHGNVQSGSSQTGLPAN